MSKRDRHLDYSILDSTAALSARGYRDSPVPDFETFTAEKIRLRTGRAISQREMTAAASRAELSSRMDHMRMCMFVDLDTYIHGLPKERISIHRSWPKTWWDAFKYRWFPKWARERWPIEYESIDVEQTIYSAVCPHLQDDPQRTHLQWMSCEHRGRPA